MKLLPEMLWWVSLRFTILAYLWNTFYNYPYGSANKEANSISKILTMYFFIRDFNLFGKEIGLAYGARVFLVPWIFLDFYHPTLSRRAFR